MSEDTYCSMRKKAAAKGSGHGNLHTFSFCFTDQGWQLSMLFSKLTILAHKFHYSFKTSNCVWNPDKNFNIQWPEGMEGKNIYLPHYYK